MKAWIVIAACAIVVAEVSSAHAQISAAIANKCRAMMIEAHPTQRYGTSGTAALQRAYFQECVRRKGNMDPPPPDQHRVY